LVEIIYKAIALFFNNSQRIIEQMFDLDKWQEIILSLSKHKLRTSLTAFGVFWGIFMLVLLLGAGNGLKNGAEYEFRDDATNSLWIYPRRTSMAHKGLSENRQINFENADYEMLKAVKGTEYITGRFYLHQDLEKLVYNNVCYNFRVRSVHPDHKVLENTIMEQGRYLNKRDIEDYRKVVVIGQLVKEEIFPNVTYGIFAHNYRPTKFCHPSEHQSNYAHHRRCQPRRGVGTRATSHQQISRAAQF